MDLHSVLFWGYQRSNPSASTSTPQQFVSPEMSVSACTSQRLPSTGCLSTDTPQESVFAGTRQQSLFAGFPQQSAGTLQQSAGFPQQSAGTPQQSVCAGTPQQLISAGTPQKPVFAGFPQQSAGTPLQSMSAGTPQQSVTVGMPCQQSGATPTFSQAGPSRRRMLSVLVDPAHVMDQNITYEAKDIGRLGRALAAQAFFGDSVLRALTPRGDTKRGLMPLDLKKLRDLFSKHHPPPPILCKPKRHRC